MAAGKQAADIAKLPKALADALRSLLGEERFLTDVEALSHYGRDWTRFVAPAPSGGLLPISIEEIQTIVCLAFPVS